MCSSGECEHCKRRAAVAAAEWAALNPKEHLGGKIGAYGQVGNGVLRKYEAPPVEEVEAINVGFLNPEIFKNAKK